MISQYEKSYRIFYCCIGLLLYVIGAVMRCMTAVTFLAGMITIILTVRAFKKMIRAKKEQPSTTKTNLQSEQPAVVSPAEIPHDAEPHYDGILGRVQDIYRNNPQWALYIIPTSLTEDKGTLEKFMLKTQKPGSLSENSGSIRRKLSQSILGDWRIDMDPTTDTIQIARKAKRSMELTAIPDYDPAVGVLPWGIDDRGEEVYLKLYDQSGVVIGGEPGSGKTGSTLPILAALTKYPAFLTISDGKQSADYEPFTQVAQLINRRSDPSSLTYLQRLEFIRALRSRIIIKITGVSNYWHLTTKDKARFPLVITVLDEFQYFFLKNNAQGKKNMDLAERLVKMGRSAGFITFFTTQKPTADAMPTAIRDNCGIRICFQVTSRFAAEATLGTGYRESGLDPVQLKNVGENVIFLEDERRWAEVQANFMKPEKLASLIKASDKIAYYYQSLRQEAESILDLEEKSEVNKDLFFAAIGVSYEESIEQGWLELWLNGGDVEKKYANEIRLLEKNMKHFFTHESGEFIFLETSNEHGLY